MSITSSPQQDITQLLGRRKLATIPKDQREILNKPDSWVTGTIEDAGARVPGHVLDTTRHVLKARLKLPSRSATQRQSTEPSVNLDQPAEQSPPPSPAGQSSPPKSQTTPQSSPGRRIAWSQSPNRDAPQRPESSAVEETPQVTRPVQHVLKPRPIPDGVAMSSQDEEPEMETEVPQPFQSTDVPVNREASRVTAWTPAPRPPMVETPTCAQKTIPGTEPGESMLPQELAEKVRRRRMKAIVFEGTTPVKPANASTSFTRMPSTNVQPEVDSSLSSASSSLVPGTAVELPEVNAAILDQSDGQSLCSPVKASQPEPAAGAGSRTVLRQSTYDTFTSAYPEYTAQYAGSRRNFVKACMCLEFLQDERLLREFMYDDFIRAFSHKYLTYVSSAREGQEPLPAIEWFNMLEGFPIFTKMIIAKTNLAAVLVEHPDEVSHARRHISGDTPKLQPTTFSPSSHPDATPITAPTLPSPVLGSQNPTPSRRSKSFRPSQLLERLSSTPPLSRKRSTNDEARLREHFRKRRTLDRTTL